MISQDKLKKYARVNFVPIYDIPPRSPTLPVAGPHGGGPTCRVTGTASENTSESSRPRARVCVAEGSRPRGPLPVSPFVSEPLQYKLSPLPGVPGDGLVTGCLT